MMRLFIPVFVFFVCQMQVFAKTYYVDYEAGSDSKSGTSESSAWQHCPGDAEAAKSVASAVLGPGDIVRFKGGVVYRGQINITASGSAGNPIVYDGNCSDDWGAGRAVIDGAVPLENLKPCLNAAEAFGNPDFEKIYWTYVPAGSRWDTLNVRQENRSLAVAQDPNPADPIFQEDPKYFVPTEPSIPYAATKFRIKPLGGMKENGARPVRAIFEESSNGGVINQMVGGAIEISLDEPQTVTSFSVQQQSTLYTAPRTVSFTADGREVLVAELGPPVAKPVEVRFPLRSSVTFTNLVIRFVAAYPVPGKTDSETPTWGVVKKIGGYDASGKNVLLAEPRGVFENKAYFTQQDPAFFNNALFALHAKPNFVYYKRILSYDPAENRITFETLNGKEVPYEKGGSFSIVNCIQHVDQPGEYALLLNPEADGRQKLFVRPLDDKPESLVRAQYGAGFSLSKASFITIQGFWVRGQGRAGSEGITCQGAAEGLTIRNVEVSGLRGQYPGIGMSRINNVLIEGCTVQNNGGHTKGIVIRNARNIVVRGCTMRKNSSTAIDFYTVTNGVVQDCLVTENAGMHANGLTFYVGCENILVERNQVREGGAALTAEEGGNMIIRNNVLEGGKQGSPAIALWGGYPPFNNILIVNNLLRFYGEPGDWAAAVYGGNPSAKGYSIVNNIIDGFGGDIEQKADFHHNLFTRYGAGLIESQLRDNLFEADLGRIFVAPDQGNYRLKAGSPAIGAGVAVQSLNQYDILGASRGSSRKFDIGPYVYAAGDSSANKLIPVDPDTFTFSFDGFTFTNKVSAPIEAVYTMRFKEKAGVESVVERGMDFSAEGGGKVSARPGSGHILGWDDPGHWLEWILDVPETGLYEIVIEHASQSSPAMRSLIVNAASDNDLNQISFRATGAWTNFMKTGIQKPLALKKGRNTLRFTNVSGPLNLKSITAIAVDP